MKWQGAGHIASPFSLEATVDEPISPFEKTYECAEANPVQDGLSFNNFGISAKDRTVQLLTYRCSK
jgi:hypothetical protein